MPKYSAMPRPQPFVYLVRVDMGPPPDIQLFTEVEHALPVPAHGSAVDDGRRGRQAVNPSADTLLEHACWGWQVSV